MTNSRLVAAMVAAIVAQTVGGHPFGLAPYFDTIELMWLQDFSISYEDDLPNLLPQLPDLFEELKWVFPHSHFGIAGFTDKPMEPFGYEVSKDYCYQLKYPLSRYTARIQEALAKSQIHSGGDWKEAQLQALLSATLPETNWWPNITTPNGYNIHRIIVLTTDSGFHQSGDAATLPANKGDGTFTGDCTGEDYPSVAQVKDALVQQRITPIFLVTTDVLPLYRRLVRDLGGLGIVWPIATDSKNVKKALFNSLNLLLENDCNGNDCDGCKGDRCCETRDCDAEADAVEIHLEQVPRLLKVWVNN